MAFDDARRVEALNDYRLLDTPPEQIFDNVVQLAAQIFRTPISLISLVAADRQWFKARFGLEVSETPRRVAFCDHAVRADATLLVSDAQRDPRFAQNPLVTGAPHIRFYCGVPLRTPDQQSLGTLCLIDSAPRQMGSAELAALERLAHQVELELELRRRLLLVEEALESARTAQRSSELLAAMIVHDMRNPLTSLTLLATAVLPADEPSKLDLESILAEAERMGRMLSDALDVCLHHLGNLRLRRADIDLTTLAQDAAGRARRLGRLQSAEVTLDAPASAPLNADPELLARVLENLITNAIQHAHGIPRVTLQLRTSTTGATLCVSDQGTTIPEAERARIFEPLERGSLAAGRAGRGLGLTFCKLAVQAHGGTITLRANGNGPGNCFEIWLPSGLRPLASEN